MELTFDPKPPMRYAFVPIMEQSGYSTLINGVDVLYHESTKKEHQMRSTAKRCHNFESSVKH
jgi:hypothetical protein